MITWAQEQWSKLPAIIKLVGTIAGAAGAMAAAVVAIPPAWSMLGLPVTATRAYVHEAINPIQLAQDKSSAAIDRLLLNQSRQQLYETQKDPAAGTSPVVQQRIQEIQVEIEHTQKRIDAAGQGR